MGPSHFRRSAPVLSLRIRYSQSTESYALLSRSLRYCQSADIPPELSERSLDMGSTDLLPDPSSNQKPLGSTFPPHCGVVSSTTLVKPPSTSVASATIPLSFASVLMSLLSKPPPPPPPPFPIVNSSQASGKASNHLSVSITLNAHPIHESASGNALCVATLDVPTNSAKLAGLGRSIQSLPTLT